MCLRPPHSFSVSMWVCVGVNREMAEQGKWLAEPCAHAYLLESLSPLSLPCGILVMNLWNTFVYARQLGLRYSPTRYATPSTACQTPWVSSDAQHPLAFHATRIYCWICRSFLPQLCLVFSNDIWIFIIPLPINNILFWISIDKGIESAQC